MRPSLLAALLVLSPGLHAQWVPSTLHDHGHRGDAPAIVIIGEVPDRLSAGTPLTVRKNAITPSHLDLSWGDSCGPDQNDFAIYEGTLGNWYSHAGKLCGTGGGLSVSDLNPAAGNRYYLAVPLSGASEGIYGTNSAGGQIPPGAAPCRATQDSTACSVGKRAFVSSAGYSANFGGALAADAICQSLASAAALGGAWKAWVSDSSSSPATRFTHLVVPYRRVDGTLIASNWADLTDGSLTNGVTTNEYGIAVTNADVWTATNPNGTYAGSGCNDFTSNLPGAPYVYVGISDRSTSGWTAIYLQFCDRTGNRIYCFEQ